MKKKLKQIISAILVAIMLVGVMPITGFAEEIYDYYGEKYCMRYEIAGDHVKIIDFSSDLEDVVIPEEIEGYPVTVIGDCAFNSNESIKSISIPNTVTDIEYGAFGYCKGLESIYIPASVKNIENCFYMCTNLQSINVDGNNVNYSSDSFGVLYSKDGKDLIQYPIGNDRKTFNIPDAVEKVSDYAFCNCKLYELNITKNVSSISGLSFLRSENLSFISVSEKNNYYSNDACGVLYNKNKTVLVQYPVGSERIKYSIPNCVVEVGRAAFFKCLYLKEIDISDNVKTICRDAFYGCLELCSINFGNSIEEIHDHAFAGCEKIKNLYFPDSLRLIRAVAFSGCTGLKTVVLGSNIKEIGGWAFSDCIDITDVYFKGTETMWKAIDIGEDNDALLSANIQYNYNLSHTHTLNHITVPSTCKVAGMEYDICTECGETLNEKALPLAAHKWSDWAVVKEPTATEEGIEKRTCSVCGDSETRSIDKFNGLRDSETGVEIIYNDEYSDGTELKVEEKFSGKSFQLIDTAYGKTNTAIYDISTYKDGVKVQPNGEITVRVPLPKGFSANKVFVCYVDSTNGKVTKIPCEVKDGYVVFKTDHFSEYAVVEQLACVKSVSISDITLNYKKSATIKPTVKADDGAKYTVKYSSSNTKVATVDKNGKVYGAKKGTATITCTVTDSNGNTVQDTCKVTVKYSFGQWLIVILLFGWIWYI